MVISSPAKAGPIGEGDLTLKPFIVDHFIKYIRGGQKKPAVFFITNNGESTWYLYCPYSECRSHANEDVKFCERETNQKCKIFAKGRYVKWKNGINTGKGKESKFSSKMSKEEVRAKLTKLGFLGRTTSTTTKVEKKKETKTTKITTGKRSLAMSWKGYDNLILGSLTFKEEDLVGNIDVKLPNNDGNCKGTYALSTDKGTWSLLCANDMSASGTLKWNNQDGSVTGEGKDAKGNVVKFTVEGES